MAKAAPTASAARAAPAPAARSETRLPALLHKNLFSRPACAVLIDEEEDQSCSTSSSNS